MWFTTYPAMLERASPASSMPIPTSVRDGEGSPAGHTDDDIPLVEPEVQPARRIFHRDGFVGPNEPRRRGLSCGAGTFQHLLGRPLTDGPLRLRRVTGSGRRRGLRRRSGSAIRGWRHRAVWFGRRRHFTVAAAACAGQPSGKDHARQRKSGNTNCLSAVAGAGLRNDSCCPSLPGTSVWAAVV